MRKRFEPRGYQQLISQHQLDTPRGGTFAEMGLGKTVATLNTIQAEHLSGMQTKPALVLAPLRVAQSTWPDEAAKWEHLSGTEVQPIVGTDAQRRRALKNTNAGVFTVNYENIPWLIEALDGEFPFGQVIADESTKLKSFRLKQGGQRAQALARIAHTKAEQWKNLTGTPTPKSLTDLWGQVWFLDGGARLGRSFHTFTRRWFKPDWSGYGVVAMPHAQEEIQALISDICLSVRARDWFDLKEPVVNKIMLDLPKPARKLYEDMEKEMFIELEGGVPVEAFSAGAKTGKCAQLANGAIYTEAPSWKEVHTVKLQALESIIDDAQGKPVLVAYNFKSDLARLKAAFPKARVLDDNPQTIRDWNAGKIPVLLAHPASCGHGLNLQDGGHILVFFGLDWNLEYHDQMIERIGPTRQMQAGHDRLVFIHYLLVKDTVDEIMLERHASKRGVQDILMDYMRRKK